MRLKTTKVKTAKNRSLSSTKWLSRQLNDQYVIKSKSDGYRSRAAYKLEEINQKFQLIKKDSKILDLGAAPGGWSQIASKLIGAKGKIVAIDLLQMDEIPGVIFFQGDFCDIEMHSKLIESLEGQADIIMSDMAPNTTGHKATDHIRIIDLCERVFDFAQHILKPGGTVIVKLFQGGTEANLLAMIKQNFSSVKHFKPESSRKESSEIYLVASGYRG